MRAARRYGVGAQTIVSLSIILLYQEKSLKYSKNNITARRAVTLVFSRLTGVECVKFAKICIFLHDIEKIIDIFCVLSYNEAKRLGIFAHGA